MLWETHTRLLQSELSRVLGLMYHVRRKLPQTVRLLTYYSLFNSRLIYGIESWGTAANRRLLSVQRIQNQALKIVYAKPILFSTFDLYSKVAMKMLPVKALHQLSVAVLFYKIKHELIVSNLQFERLNHRYALRRRSNISIPSHANKYGLQRFQRTAAQIWNEMTNAGVHKGNLKIFKKSATEYLRSRLAHYLV